MEINIYIERSFEYIQHDDDDDAKYQIIHNPVTYRECDDPSNVNFNLNTIEQNQTKFLYQIKKQYKEVLNGIKINTLEILVLKI